MLDQVEGVEHHRMAVAPGAQRMEVRPSIIAGNHRLAVDQERDGLDAERGINDGREAIGPVMAAAREAADPWSVPARTSCLVLAPSLLPRAAVTIEPSLRPRPPENGNIREVGRRLSAIWAPRSAK
jgi:hypothetical protein